MIFFLLKESNLCDVARYITLLRKRNKFVHLLVLLLLNKYFWEKHIFFEFYFKFPIFNLTLVPWHLPPITELQLCHTTCYTHSLTQESSGREKRNKLPTRNYMCFKNLEVTKYLMWLMQGYSKPFIFSHKNILLLASLD